MFIKTSTIKEGKSMNNMTYVNKNNELQPLTNFTTDI